MGDVPAGEGSRPLVELRDIVKEFPGTRALDRVSLTVDSGEVHGLLGENGAGKSTLVSILYGLYRPDSGSISVDGSPTRIRSPRDALANGIAVVQQHFALVSTLTVAENVVLGAEPGASVARSRIAPRVARLAEQYDLDLDAEALVRDLSIGERQRVEILKCLYRDPRVLVLDEPTTVLTPAEVEDLFGVLRSLAARAKGIVLITHKLDELLALCDRISVLRTGRVVGSVRSADVDPSDLARLMVGRDVEVRSVAAFVGLHSNGDRRGQQMTLDHGSTAEDESEGPPALRVTSMTARDVDGIVRLQELDLQVRAGEVLGLAGVEGNGQRALAEILCGVQTASGGSLEINGQDLTNRGPRALGAAGLRVITEDRQTSGLVLDMTIAENLVADRMHCRPWSNWGVINPRAVRRTADDLASQFAIRLSDVNAPVRTLSGGNQQRVVVARELSRSTTVLVASQPTRGLDVGAIEELTNRLSAIRDQGVAVLLISSDLAEILTLADRVAVIHRGRVTVTLERADASPEVLAPYLAGIGQRGPRHEPADVLLMTETADD